MASLLRDLGPQRARRVARAVAHGGQVVVSVASGDDATQTTRHQGRAPLEGVREVAVEHPYGDLQVVGDDECHDLAWTLQCETHGASATEDAATVDCESRGDRLVLKVRIPQGISPTKAALELRLPRSLDVRCEGANGRLVTEGLRGRLRARSGNGEVSVSDHEGAFEITALNGPVGLSRLAGDGDLRVDNGSLDVREGSGRWGVRVTNGAVKIRGSGGRLRLDVQHGNVDVEGFAGELRVETVIGSVRLMDTAPDVQARSARTGSVEAQCSTLPENGRIELRAATGDVTLRLAPDTQTRIAMQTTSGRIDCALPLEDVERSPHAVVGVLGSARAQVILETVLGNVRVETAPL